MAEVDDKLRLQAVDTWMDPLAMFRQIAPQGVVNKEVLNHKVEEADALDDAPNHDGVKIAEEYNQPKGEHSNDVAPEEAVEKHVSGRTGRPPDGFVPQFGSCPFTTQPGAESERAILPSEAEPVDAMYDDAVAAERQAPETIPMSTETLVTETLPPTTGAISTASDVHPGQEIVAVAADHGGMMDIDKPEPNAQETTLVANTLEPPELPADSKEGVEKPCQTGTGPQTGDKRSAEDVPRSMYSSAVNGNVEDVMKAPRSDDIIDESVATGTHDAIDQHLEQSANEVHPHSKEVEQEVKPDAGEAVAASTDSEETRKTQEEMSKIRPYECPTIMNRE